MHTIQMGWSPSLETEKGCVHSAALQPWTCCHSPAALSLVGRGRMPRMGSGIDLKLALEPIQKTLSGKIVKK